MDFLHAVKTNQLYHMFRRGQKKQLDLYHRGDESLSDAICDEVRSVYTRVVQQKPWLCKGSNHDLVSQLWNTFRLRMYSLSINLNYVHMLFCNSNNSNNEYQHSLE